MNLKLQIMEHKTINIAIEIFSENEYNPSVKILVDAAKEASTRAYSPYSKFNVGAAVRLDNGIIVTGNNQENAAYPSGLCGERTALFYASSQYPDAKVEAISIIAQKDGKFINSICCPCGGCRQVMLEMETKQNRKIDIYICSAKEAYLVHSVKDLLPLSFEEIPE